MRHLKAGDYLRTPWKNGGGETVQLAVHPAGAGLDDFAWRISMATIDRDGPFSLFAGVDRSLSLIDGAGVVLDIDGERHRLEPGSAPISFAGGAGVMARLVAGPVTDFNVMTRRGVAGHSLAVMREGESHAAATGFAAIFAAGAARIVAGEKRFELAQGELLVLDPGVSGVLEAGRALKLRCWLVP
jgi:environmental stress-induced protein Ves